MRQQAPAEIDGQQRTPEQMFAEIRRLQKENEYLKRQREILKKSDEHPGRGTESRYAMIKELSVDFDVKECCEAMRVSRSGYYRWRSAKPSRREKEDAQMIEQIKDVFESNQSRYGSPRITKQLHQQGLTCGKNRIVRLMQENKLAAPGKKAFRPRTTVAGQRCCA